MTSSLRQKADPITQADLDSGVAAKLHKIQGNILRSHGRNRLVLLVLSIEKGASVPKVRAALGGFAVKHVTSSADQLKQTIAYRLAVAQSPSIATDVSAKLPAEASKVFGSLFLTASGYARLNFSTAGFRDASFVSGMKTSGPERLGDPEPSDWEAAYQRPVHGMLLLAGDDAIELESVAVKVKGDFEAVKVQVTREDGDVPRNRANQLEDPFGFAHGLSQPLFFEEDLTKAGVSGASVPAASQWNPAAGPSLVLVQDPLESDDADALGSFLVFRKLAMDTAGFAKRVGKLADLLQGPPDLGRAAALVVGRYKDGRPLVAKPSKGQPQVNPTTFTYGGDQLGRMCPLHSHVRKSNPRVSSDDDREHRIARRGVNYRAPGQEGMLFMCYQARIWRQFEFIQRRWMNDPAFPGAGVGRDPVAGAGAPLRSAQWPRWPFSVKAGDVRFNFGGYVQLRGGEYFFAPSIPFLHKLRSSS
jgi:Dyp-type peroxidase family